VIEDLQKLTEAIHATDKNIQGELIISASTIPGTYLLPRLAAQFKQQHPQTRFQILINDTAESIAKVASHEIHLAVIGGNSKDVNLMETIFFEDQLVCVAEKKLARDKQNKPHAIPILIREQGSGTRQAMEEILKQAHISIEDRKVAAILGSTAAIKEALLAGLGFSIISRMAVEEELASGLLVQLHLPKIGMTRPIVFISHKKRTLPRRYQAFVEMVAESTKG
jgi:DNA-binding transcriptional LysR family regulator